MSRVLRSVHVGVPVALEALSTWGGVSAYGVSGPWWDATSVPVVLALGAGWLVVAVLPAAVLEGRLLARLSRVGAGVVAAVFGAATWLVAMVPGGLRFWGDTSPLRGSDLLATWVLLVTLVAAQGAGTAGLVRVLRRSGHAAGHSR